MSFCIISKGAETNVSYDKAIDYLNCKFVELSIKKINNEQKLIAFQTVCKCNTADFDEIKSGLNGLALKRTDSLANNVNTIKQKMNSINNYDEFMKSFLAELIKNNTTKNFYTQNKANIDRIFNSEEFKSKLQESGIWNVKASSNDSLENGIKGPKNETDTGTSTTVKSDAEETGNKVLLYFSNIITHLGLPIVVIVLIILLFKKNKKQPSTESIINAILTDQKVKEYIQKQAQGNQPASNYANNSDQFKDLISRVTDIEKIIHNIKNDSNNVINPQIPTSNLEEKKSEEKVEIFYLSTPNLDGSFNESSSSPIYKEGATIYKFTKTSFNKAKFEIDSKSASMKLALQYPDKNIDPVCDAVGPYFPTATRIATIQPGEVELQGDKWIRNTKAKISYES